jgi:DnaJ-domain-containing protein 1
LCFTKRAEADSQRQRAEERWGHAEEVRRAGADEERRRKEADSQRQRAEQRWGHAEEARDAFNPYVVLGVRRNASQDEIKRAHREMMAKYHPDKVSYLGDEFQEMAKAKAVDINRARDELLRTVSG